MRGFLRRLSRVQHVGMRDRSELSLSFVFLFFSYTISLFVLPDGCVVEGKKFEGDPEKSVPAAMDGPTVAAAPYLQYFGVRPRASTRHTVHVAYALIADLCRTYVCRKNKQTNQTNQEKWRKRKKKDMGADKVSRKG